VVVVVVMVVVVVVVMCMCVSDGQCIFKSVNHQCFFNKHVPCISFTDDLEARSDEDASPEKRNKDGAHLQVLCERIKHLHIDETEYACVKALVLFKSGDLLDTYIPLDHPPNIIAFFYNLSFNNNL